MPSIEIRVVAVSDEGNDVIVHGVPDGAARRGDDLSFVFRSTVPGARSELAEAASRLRDGDRVRVDFLEVAVGWNLGRDFESA